MVRPDMEKWGQTLADLRLLSVEAKDARSRERFHVNDRRQAQCLCLGTGNQSRQGDSLKWA